MWQTDTLCPKHQFSQFSEKEQNCNFEFSCQKSTTILIMIIWFLVEFEFSRKKLSTFNVTYTNSWFLARKFKWFFFVSLELQRPFRKYVSFSMNGTIKKKKIIVNGYDSCKTKDQRSMKLIGLNWTMKWHIERNWSVKRRKMHPIQFIGKMSKKKYCDKNTSKLGNYFKVAWPNQENFR